MPKNVLTHLDLNKNEIRKAVIENLSSAPSSPVVGQFFYNTTTGQPEVYDGSAWDPMIGGGSGILSIQDPLLDPASYERNLVYNGGHGFMSDGADWKPISAVTWGLGSDYGMIPGHIYWQTPADIGTGTTSLTTPGGQEVVYGWRFTSTSGTTGGITFDQSSCDNENGEVFSGLAYTNSDATFQALLNSYEFRTASGPLNLTLTGLIPGNKYALQLFAVDKRAEFGARVQKYSDPHGNESDTVTHNTEKYIIGEFIADSSTLTISASYVSGPSMATIINLVVLRRYTAFTANLQLHLRSIPVLSVDSSRVNLGVGNRAYASLPANTTAIGSFSLSNATGAGNTTLGFYAGNSLTSGAYNTLLGPYAGQKITTGGYNIALGSNSLGDASAAVTGSHNIVAGFEAGRVATSMAESVLIGREAGRSATTPSGPVLIGAYAGRSLTTAIEATLLGMEAGYTATTAASITAIGHRALYNATTANSNVAIGKSALGLNGTGGQNTAVGHRASNNTTGGLNTTVGFEAHYTNASGVSNVAIGYQAGYAATVNNNTFIGYHAGRKVSSGSGNIAIGHQSLGENSAAFASSNCIGIGTRSFNNATSGNGIAIGIDALNACTTGGLQVAIGDLAGTSITTGVQGTFVGREAGRYNTGNETTAIGCYSGGGSGSTGSGNIYLGRSAGNHNGAHTGTYNIFIGSNAGAGFTSADDCVIIGREALSAAHSGGQAGTIAIGRDALTSCTTGLRNVAIGYQTLSSVATVADNTALGWRALWKTTAASNVGLGTQAGQELTTGTENVYIGKTAGYSGTTCTYNIGIGTYTLGSTTTGSFNVAVGQGCMYTNVTGGSNTAFGHGTGSFATGYGGTYIGQGAGGLVTSGDQNTLVGLQAADALTTGSYNVALGSNALGAATTSSYNVCLGYNAGLGITTATGGNTCVGSSAGDNITTGSNNIVIGKDVDAQSPTASGQINFANCFLRESWGMVSFRPTIFSLANAATSSDVSKTTDRGGLVLVTNTSDSKTALFLHEYGSAPVLISGDAAHWANTDTASRACLYDAGSGVLRLKNNLGSSKNFYVFAVIG